MGRSVAAVVVSVLVAACGAAQTPSSAAFDAGSIDLDAGDPQPALPPSQTFHTSLGTLIGSEAFPIASAQTLLENDGGPQTYVGFQVSDAEQCLPADADGGAPAATLETTHVLTGFVRTFDGTQVQLGVYNIGQNNPNQVQAYLEMVEFDRSTGDARTLLATGGTLTIASLSGGQLEVSTDVTLGDPVTQFELPFTGSFASQVCSAISP